jgi:hypothetical protein
MDNSNNEKSVGSIAKLRQKKSIRSKTYIFAELAHVLHSNDLGGI